MRTEDPVGLAISNVGLPMVIKPSKEGSSFGVSICKSAEDVGPAIDLALELDEKILAEKFIIGREMTCSVIGDPVPEPLPLVEIMPGEEHLFFDYVAKYTPGATKEVCPADLDKKTTSLIQKLAVKAHCALGLRRYSRVDFILGKNGPVILEANTIPGMTETSLLPLAANKAGMDFPALMDRLVQLALHSDQIRG